MLSHVKQIPSLKGGGKATHFSMTLFKPGQLQMGNNKELVSRDIIQVVALQIKGNRQAKEILDAGLEDKAWDEMRIALEMGTAANEAGDYMLEDGLVCFRRQVWIPDNARLKLQVAYECYDSKVARHFGRDKTLEFMK